MVQECGIGRQESEESPAGSTPSEVGLNSEGAGHRVLVFAQLKNLLELVERDVLLPGGVSFLRLDGRSAPCIPSYWTFPPPLGSPLVDFSTLPICLLRYGIHNSML